MTEHPTEVMLHRFAEGALDEAGREAVELHLDVCGECMSVLGQLLDGATASVGRRLGPFVLEALVGHGAMGAVYRATDTRLDRVVALKLPRADGAQAIERLLEEARAQARVQHPNVIALHEAAVFEGRLALVLEWCDGTTLRTWQAGRTSAEVLRAYLQAAHGLAAAHARGIVHRDFKPDNVVVDENGRVRVTDFGLASGAEHATGRAGTPAYMAPETWRQGRCDARSDQYAFAVALVEALTGERRPEQGLPLLTRALSAVLGRALAADPATRWPSMVELIAALQDAMARPRRQAAMAVATLALVAVLGFVALRPGPCAALQTRAAGLQARAPGFFDARLHVLPVEHCAVPEVHGCVERHLERLEALVTLGEQAPALATHLRAAADRIEPVSRCTTRPLAELSEPPSDALAAARVLLTKSDVLRRAGHEADALTAADDAVTRARAAGGQGTLARALVARGRALASLGQPDAAVDALRDAERSSVAANAEATRIDAQLAQVMELCRGLGATARCAEAYRRAQDAAVDPSPAVHVELLELGAAVLGQQARTLEAQAGYEAACAGWARLPGRQLELERCHHSLTVNSETAGRIDRALELSRALSAAAKEAGASRRLAKALRLEASLSLSSGDLSAARRALAEAEPLTAATGQDRARLEAVRAQVHEAGGDFAEALEAQRRALALAGTTHRGWERKQRLQLATWLAEAGRWDEAAPLFDSLAAEVADWQVRSDTDTLFGVQAMAWRALKRGETDEAARLGEWVAQSARSSSTSPRYLVPVLAWRAERLLDAGRVAEAQASVEDAERLLSGLTGAGPGLTGPTKLLRARLLASAQPAAAGRAAQSLRSELEARGFRGRLVAESAVWALVWSADGCAPLNEVAALGRRIEGLAAGRALRAAVRACPPHDPAALSARSAP
jgi:tetratricopeptide (TPR) repeat protein